MAAISLIAGSVLGWIAAALSIGTGALASTALLVYLGTSLGCTGAALFWADRAARV